MIADATPLVRTQSDIYDPIEYSRWLHSHTEPLRPYTRPRRGPRRPYGRMETALWAAAWGAAFVLDGLALVGIVALALWALRLLAALTGRI